MMTRYGRNVIAHFFLSHIIFNTNIFVYRIIWFRLCDAGANGVVFILFGILPLPRIEFNAFLFAFMTKQIHEQQ